MDIKAVQAEAVTKASTWLTQNLPAEGEVQTPAVPAIVPPAEAPKVETPPVKPGMADAIRRDREARAATSGAAAEAAKYKGELEALRKENEALKSLGAANDPFEFLRGRKLTKEQQALWGQAFLYDLKPEVAPQEFRLDLYKAEQARKDAEKAEAERRAGEESAQRAKHERIDGYANELIQHVMSNPGSSPESETWFTEDGPDGQPSLNHQAYAQSLLATANNLSRYAETTGQRVDLSPANVVRVLEAEVSKRMQRRDAKRASKAPIETKQVPPGQSGERTAVTATTSTDGLRSGPPIPPDTSDEARKARAAAVLFGTK